MKKRKKKGKIQQQQQHTHILNDIPYHGYIHRMHKLYLYHHCNMITFNHLVKNRFGLLFFFPS